MKTQEDSHPPLTINQTTHDQPIKKVAAKDDRVTDGTRPVLLMAASFPT